MAIPARSDASTIAAPGSHCRTGGHAAASAGRPPWLAAIAISSADIRNELFEGENSVIGKTDNGQSQLVSGPFVTKKEE
jgi:hypothetical protein